MRRAKTNTTRDVLTTGIPRPGRDLYDLVRGGLIQRGSSLAAWCDEAGESYSSARSALVGIANGPGSRRLRDRLIQAAGLTEAA